MTPLNDTCRGYHAPLVTDSTTASGTRLGLIIPANADESIDVIFEGHCDGGHSRPIIRINIFNHANGTQTVDVINLSGKRMRAITWENGECIFRSEVGPLTAIIREDDKK